MDTQEPTTQQTPPIDQDLPTRTETATFALG
jgi:hypothetical protein